jgi:hypothetical protein
MLKINHQIAGINFLTDSDVQLPHLLQPFYAKFLFENAQPDICFRIRAINPDFLPISPLDAITRRLLLETIGFPGFWLDRPILRSPEVWQKVEACLERPELAHISLRWNRAIIRNYAYNDVDFFYPPEQKVNFASQLIIASHRNMLAAFMPNFSAVMLHGAGIIRNDVAALFFAPDEGGKSSMIRLSAGNPVLNDDQIILRKQNGVVMAHGTPFGPITNGPLQSTLGSIFLLEKSSHFALTPLPLSAAVEFIWNEHAHMWIVMPRSLRIKAFELIADACHQARIYRLQFPKGYIDWNAVDDAISGGSSFTG